MYLRAEGSKQISYQRDRHHCKVLVKRTDVQIPIDLYSRGLKEDEGDGLAVPRST